MSNRPAIRPMTTHPEAPSVEAVAPRPRPPDRRSWPLRWGSRALFLALVGLNAWWIWGDRSPAAMKAIDALIARGRLDDAERALRNRLRWSPDDGDARMKLARILGARGDQLGCARQLHRVARWWPTKAEASFLEGQAFKRVARARDAEAAWKTCLVDDPLHPVPPQLLHGAARELVVLSILEGRLDQARETLWRAYDAATPAERPGVLAMRLRAELERVAHDEAVAKLRDYVAADPEDWDARRALALEELATGDAVAADRDIEACLRARPDDPLSWRARLEILDQRGDADGSRAAVDRLPPTTGDDARIWRYRGVVRQSSGDFPGAFEAFRRSDQFAPNDAETLYKLGLAEQRLGRLGPAREHLARSRELHQVFGRLRDAYFDFLDQSRRSPVDQAAYRASIERLEAICRQLGWQREADAWRRELGTG